ALSLSPASALLVGFNGAAQKLDLAAGTLAPVMVPASETLVKLVDFHGHLIAVGRRGAQDLGPVTK
ncbi:MAG TPA: hypothetical protein VHE37_06315, partial [Nevskiaceae bacterium]|nr:hypothetical protein [Nevskiaceae bacterium]